MRLVRNTTVDGSCKYRLINTSDGSIVEDGKPRDEHENKELMLKDINSTPALLAYATSISSKDPEFAEEIYEMAKRSGYNHPNCKEPD